MEHENGVVHRPANRFLWPWLPIRHGGPLAAHPYCEDCGLVKYVGSNRALAIGGLMNLLGKLEKQLEEWDLTFTEAQMRLISRRLGELELGDSYGLSRESQIRTLADVVAGALGLHAGVVESYLRSC